MKKNYSDQHGWTTFLQYLAAPKPECLTGPVRHRMNFPGNLFVFMAAFLACTAWFTGTAAAHDLWLNLDNYFLKSSGKTLAKVIFGHNYPHYGILVSRDQLNEFFYLTPDGHKKEIHKTWEEFHGESYGRPAGARVGQVECEQEGTYIVTAVKKRKGDSLHVPSEKYAKSVIVVGKGSAGINWVVGHRIEIIPLKNPTEVRAGQAFPVKVLFEGKPLATYVYGTYAGYASEDEPFPVLARSDENGIARIRIDRPGTWMVVTNHKVDFSASLTFQIK